jgi:hypothetical protein
MWNDTAFVANRRVELKQQRSSHRGEMRTGVATLLQDIRDAALGF